MKPSTMKEDKKMKNHLIKANLTQSNIIQTQLKEMETIKILEVKK